LGHEGIDCSDCSDCSDWSTCQQQPAGEGLITALRRLLSAGSRFAVTYDFRRHLPDREFTNGLAEFYQAHVEQWADHLQSAALLIQENILAAVIQGPVASFLRACPLGCPFVVCHNAGMAEEFIQACLGMPAAAPFLSVVDVLDDPRPASACGKMCKPRSCLASLAPLLPRIGLPMEAHMLHELPNGDTRVIQSPPQDVVVRAGSEHASEGQWAVDDEVKPLASAFTDETEDIATMAALAFDCPREELQQLVGAHFHVGELTVDAESEAFPRAPWHHQGRIPCASVKDATDAAVGADSSCVAGLKLLLQEALAALFLGLQCLAKQQAQDHHSCQSGA